MNIYVFKTSISEKDLQRVEFLLLSLIPKSRWNFDLEDCDNILRIESMENVATLIPSRLRVFGFDCEELE